MPTGWSGASVPSPAIANRIAADRRTAGGLGFADSLCGGAGNDVLTDPDGAARAAGGAGDDVIRVTSSHPAMRFDVSGGAGDDQVELSGTWDRARVSGGSGTDTLADLGVGLVVPVGIEVFN